MGTTGRRREMAMGLVLPLVVLVGLAVLALNQEQPAACLAFMAVVPFLSALFAPVLAAGAVALATVLTAGVTAAATYGQRFSDAIPILVGVILAAGVAVMSSQLRRPVAPHTVAVPVRRPVAASSAPASPPGAGVDDLTGLPTRAEVEGDLGGPNSRDPRLIALIDIDGLAGINATHGRDIGDVFLFAVAGRTRFALGDDDIVARWGDDEFLLMVPEGAADLLEHVGDKVNANPIRTDSGLVPATICLGAVVWPTGGRFEDAVAGARRALSTAKAQGPGHVVVDLGTPI